MSYTKLILNSSLFLFWEILCLIIQSYLLKKSLSDGTMILINFLHATKSLACRTLAPERDCGSHFPYAHSVHPSEVFSL